MSYTSAAYRGERRIVGVLAACGMLSSLQFTLVVPILPEASRLLGVSAGDAAWLVTITLLVGTVGTPVLSRLADMYGRRRMLLVAMTLLVAGSVLAAAVPTFTAILVGRALQGFAVAVVPIGISLLSALVKRRRAEMGMALISGTLGVGSAVGLALAGSLVTWGGLPAIFWLSAAAGSVFTALVVLFVREAPARDPGRFDLIGAVLLSLGLVALMLVLSRAAAWGPATGTTIGTLAVAASALTGWLLWERRHPSPVIDVRTSLRSPVLQINVASFVATFGMYANHLLTAQEALAPTSTGYGLGLPLTTAGFLLAASAVSMILLSPVAGRMLSRFGGRITLAVGAAVMTAAFVFRLLFHGSVPLVAVGAALVGSGVALAFAAMPALIMASVPAHQTAGANGVNSLARSLSGAVAGAAFALVIMAAPAGPESAYLSASALSWCFAAVAVCAAVTCLLALGLAKTGITRPPSA
ncbi:MFS transporter [Microbacterium sp. zg.Y1084]|uniref:MFS transporter n=1 Tax=Microbacterium sp. zg.Y1084 TaxID=2969667 RepID=UPI00214B09F1|nr:MFS transporter [Microbacterium sp. zg.Y1084]MCR2813304.1 MFS transporter [Microbacterium sp. zg.Y1084]